MTTSKTTLFCVGACAVFFLVLCGLLAAPAVAQKREYKEAHVYVTAPSVTDTSASAGQLGADRGFQAFAPLDQPDEHDPTIIIDESKTFQTIEGFGGAFTDAAATTFGKLPKEAQEAFLKACFDPVEGNGYTLCRTTIHSCDYSADMYTYDETPGDKELKDFSIKHDLTDRIPFIKRAMAVAGKDTLCVTEKAGPRAKVYDFDGTLQAVIASAPFDPNCKNMSVAVDGRGVVYVADTVKLAIFAFRPVTL